MAASNLKTIVSGSKLINKKVRQLRKNRAGVVLYPLSVESQYRAELLAILNFTKRQVEEILKPQIPSLRQIYEMSRPIKKDSAYDDLVALFDSIRSLTNSQFPKSKINTLAENVAGATSIFNRRQVTEAYRRSVGVDPLLREPWLGDELQSFAFLNSRLISTIPEKYLDDVQHRIFDGLNQGTRAEEIADELIDAYGVSERRAALIARDQIGKLNGELNMLRNQELGSKSYTWLTMGDDRVRDSHAEQNGEVFEWSDPPQTGHPGMDYNCRCIAAPIFNDEP